MRRLKKLFRRRKPTTTIIFPAGTTVLPGPLTIDRGIVVRGAGGDFPEFRFTLRVRGSLLEDK